MESLIIKITNKYICFHSLYKVRGSLETNDIYFREAWKKKGYEPLIHNVLSVGLSQRPLGFLRIEG